MTHTDYSNIVNTEFPYLNPNNSGDWAYGNCSEDSWFWEVPTGWRNLFIDMCREINELLDKFDIDKSSLIVHQVKEKFGDLRFYFDAPTTIYDKIDEIVEKYSDKSYYTCIDCGKPATKISKGWISPYCDDCIGDRKYINLSKENEVQENESVSCC